MMWNTITNLLSNNFYSLIGFILLCAAVFYNMISIYRWVHYIRHIKRIIKAVETGNRFINNIIAALTTNVPEYNKLIEFNRASDQRNIESYQELVRSAKINIFATMGYLLATSAMAISFYLRHFVSGP